MRLHEEVIYTGFNKNIYNIAKKNILFYNGRIKSETLKFNGHRVYFKNAGFKHFLIIPKGFLTTKRTQIRRNRLNIINHYLKNN